MADHSVDHYCSVTGVMQLSLSECFPHLSLHLFELEPRN